MARSVSSSHWLHPHHHARFDNPRMRPDNLPISPSLPLKVTATCALMLAYLAGMYFHAATASLSDAYQPGLGRLKLYVQPGIALWALPLLAYGLKSATRAKVAQRCALISPGPTLAQAGICTTTPSPSSQGQSDTMHSASIDLDLPTQFAIRMHCSGCTDIPAFGYQVFHLRGR